MKKHLAIILALLMILSGYAPLTDAQCIVPASGVNVQTGNYSALANDAGKLIVMNCSSACTLTLPNPPPTSVWWIQVVALGAGVVTVSRNTLNIDAIAQNLTFINHQGTIITTDGANYFTQDAPSTYYAGGGTAQAQTATNYPGVSGLVAGAGPVCWLPAVANSGAGPTLAVNGLTAKTITKNGTVALAQNDLITTVIACAYYDGTEWQLLNPQTVATASILATGIVDGTAPVTVSTSASVTLGGTYNSGYTFNEDATAGAAITFTLPTAAVGKQYCVKNANNGSAANTGTLELLTSATGQFIIFTDGTLTATGGFVQSGGAAGDAACVVGIDSTHWILYTQSGVWTKH